MSTTVSFASAVERRDYSLLQVALSGMSKRDAERHLQSLFPHLTRQWINRSLPYLMALDPAGLESVLSYTDTTGERAVRNVMAEAAA